MREGDGSFSANTLRSAAGQQTHFPQCYISSWSCSAGHIPDGWKGDSMKLWKITPMSQLSSFLGIRAVGPPCASDLSPCCALSFCRSRLKLRSQLQLKGLHRAWPGLVSPLSAKQSPLMSVSINTLHSKCTLDAELSVGLSLKTHRATTWQPSLEESR